MDTKTGVKILDVLPLTKQSYITNINDRLSKVKKLKMTDSDITSRKNNEGNTVWESSADRMQFIFDQLLDRDKLNALPEKIAKRVRTLHNRMTNPKFSFNYDIEKPTTQFEDYRVHEVSEHLQRIAFNESHSFLSREMYRDIDKLEASIKAEVIFAYFSCLRVPEKIINPLDERYNILMDNLPKANVHDIRILANKLHMVIIPVEFSHPDIMFGDNEKLRKMYNLYSSNNDNMYMMCPINYYSNIRHIQHNRVSGDEKKDMYIPDRFLHIFESIDITMSTMELMFDKIENLEDKMKALDGKFDQLARRVKIIEDEVFTKRQTTDMGGSIQRDTTPVFKYQSLDPMLISIPKGENINDFDGETSIYMLWGDDLPDILLENKNLEVFKENVMSYPEKVYDWIYESTSGNTIDHHFASLTEKLKSLRMDSTLSMNDFIVNYFVSWSGLGLKIGYGSTKYNIEVPHTYRENDNSWNKDRFFLGDIVLIGDTYDLRRQYIFLYETMTKHMVGIMRKIDPDFFDKGYKEEREKYLAYKKEKGYE